MGPAVGPTATGTDQATALGGPASAHTAIKCNCYVSPPASASIWANVAEIA
jgi:hypothetical protein